MSNAGFSVEIHKVADSDKRLALFLGMAFMFVWVVAINIGIQDVAPRWFQRQFEWLSSADIPPIFLSMAFASLISAAGIWLFSGHGDKVFQIDTTGVTSVGVFANRHYNWADFELLDREVSKIVLHLKPAVRGPFGASTVIFDISQLDCSGPQLEAMLVYYRPDLYRTLHVAGPGRMG